MLFVVKFIELAIAQELKICYVDVVAVLGARVLGWPGQGRTRRLTAACVLVKGDSDAGLLSTRTTHAAMFVTCW